MTGSIKKTLALAFVAAMLTAACSKSSTPSYTATSPAAGVPSVDTAGGGAAPLMIDGATANDYGSKDYSGLKKGEVEADTDNGVNYFSPTVITGTPGQKITLELKNATTDVPHNFTLEDQNLNVDLDPGATKSVTVTFPDSGTLQFHCEYHASSGMIGELSVS